MKILTTDEAANVFDIKALRANVLAANWGTGDHVVTYQMPRDSGAKVALARLVTNVLMERGPVVLWITGSGVWPTCEHMDLFDRYRLSFGEERGLRDAPVHVLESPEDGPTLTSLLSISLFFLWDFEVTNIDTALIMTASHDEWLDCRVSGDYPDLYRYFTKHVGLAPRT
jgi:hypothetical protein